MENVSDFISLQFADPDIAGILRNLPDTGTACTTHFDQNEEYFIRSKDTFTVPSFPIHHDMTELVPGSTYLASLKQLLKNLVRLFPFLFAGTRYLFIPSEIFTPCFIQVFKINTKYYLYFLKVDINIRLADCTIVKTATNDTTAEYTSDRLYIEPLLLPVQRPEIINNTGHIPMIRLFDSTWIGESGHGYKINGYWIDREISKFISSLFISSSKRTYPFYPFKCDMNTICFLQANLTAAGRKKQLAYYHKCLSLIESRSLEIEEEMKKSKFSRDNELFRSISKTIPEAYIDFWSSLSISTYLNENEMREYSLEYKLQ